MLSTPSPERDSSESANEKLQNLRTIWNRVAEQTAGELTLQSGDARSPNQRLEAIYREGHDEITKVSNRAKSLGYGFGGERALDFGCGIGRISQALIEYYKLVDGVDISETALRLASDLNRYPGRCRYVLNSGLNLQQFRGSSYQLIYSKWVFQHLPLGLVKSYLREFARLVATDGLVIVHNHGDISTPVFRLLPPRLVSWLYNTLKRSSPQRIGHGTAAWEAHWIRPRQMCRILRQAGLEVIAVDQDSRRDGRLIGFYYFARRRVSCDRI
jgi:SAM-dependent methyltransferase